MYRNTDYFQTYGRIMQFNKNKKEPIHRWYPFVEGYSKDFIRSIVQEIHKKNIVCLEPFSGSGTTALELQNMGIKCFSFEVNPLMYLIGKAKLYDKYLSADVLKWYYFVLDSASKSMLSEVSSSFPTLYETGSNEKWNLNKDVAIAVEKIRRAIKQIDDKYYADLFTVALASILLDVSNLYRNGKCLSYKSGWKTNCLKEEDVFQRFASKVIDEMLVDITGMEKVATNREERICNYDYLYNEDCRFFIDQKIDDGSIDLVITSPPYLNSRDYTDTYMLELKALGFTNNLGEIVELRRKTLRSHVQIKWKDETQIINDLLDKTLSQLRDAETTVRSWNSSIIDMIRLYFVDIGRVFEVLFKKMRIGGLVYFNVSNSAYYGIEINTLDICASIAESIGFSIKEIRRARLLKTSPQQKESVNRLLEGVILMEKKL